MISAIIKKNNTVNINIENNIESLLDAVHEFNYGKVKERLGMKTSVKHSKVFPIIFTNLKDIYTSNITTLSRTLIEGGISTDTQCGRVFGKDWNETNKCYICGYHLPELEITYEEGWGCSTACEHVLNIYQAMTSTQLYYPGADEELIDFLKKTVYSFACTCCNKTKSNAEFITFNPDTWKWEPNEVSIENCVIQILAFNSNVKCCKTKNENKLTGMPISDLYDSINVDQRVKEINDNMKARCNILNDQCKPVPPQKTNKNLRVKYYNILTLSNILLAFRPEAIERITKNIIKKNSIKKRGGKLYDTTIYDMNNTILSDNSSYSDKPIIKSSPNLKENIFTNILNDNKRIKEIVKSSPNLKENNISNIMNDDEIIKEVVNTIQNETDKRQETIDKFFKVMEYIIINYQQKNPDIVNSHIEELKSFLDKHPEAFNESGPNVEFWLNREKTGGKKTTKKYRTRRKHNRTNKRKTKHNKSKK